MCYIVLSHCACLCVILYNAYTAQQPFGSWKTNLGLDHKLPVWVQIQGDFLLDKRCVLIVFVLEALDKY